MKTITVKLPGNCFPDKKHLQEWKDLFTDLYWHVSFNDLKRLVEKKKKENLKHETI